MLSQYTMPGVAISIAQQEALYREYLNAQMQQNGNGRKVNQANSRTGCGVENQGNQCHTAVQNFFAPPSLLPHMQSTRPPTPVLVPTGSNIFVPDPSTNPQVKSVHGSIRCNLLSKKLQYAWSIKSL